MVSMSEQERRVRAESIKRRAQRLAVLIVSTDYPLVDIAIERAKLRAEVEEFFPESVEVYERIYESRFDRLIEQWRDKEGQPL